MLSRLELLKQGNLGAFINEKQQWRDLVTRLDAVLARLEQQMNTLEPRDVPDLLSEMRLARCADDDAGFVVGRL